MPVGQPRQKAGRGTRGRGRRAQSAHDREASEDLAASEPEPELEGNEEGRAEAAPDPMGSSLGSLIPNPLLAGQAPVVRPRALQWRVSTSMLQG